MKKYVVVSAVGKDRPGFVLKLTQVIKEAGGNIELQRSTRLAAEFAVIILFSLEGESASVESVIHQLDALASDAMHIHARSAVPPHAEGDDEKGNAEITASGADQPGIIEAVTLLLFEHHINLEYMDYDVAHAPMTGEELFCMKAKLTVPEGVKIDQLREQLRDLEEDYNFDILFRYPVE